MKKIKYPKNSFIIVLLFVFLPLQWVVLFSEPVFIKPYHFIAGVLIINSLWTLLIFDRGQIRHFYSKEVVYFILFLGGMEIWKIVGLFWTPTEYFGLGVTSILLEVSEVVVFLSLVFSFTRIYIRWGEKVYFELLGISALISIWIFVFIFWVTLQRRGENLIFKYLGAISQLDIKALQFHFYPILFSNSKNISFATSLRNTVVEAINLNLILLLIWIRQKRRAYVKIFVFFTILITVFIVFASVSRFNVILAILILTMSTLPIIRRVNYKVLSLFLIAGIFFMLGHLEIIAIIKIIYLRLSAILHDPRIEMYSNAFQLIAESPWIGYGFGKEVYTGSRYLRTHNIFLLMWVEEGFLGFFISIAWYISYCYLAVNFIKRILQNVKIDNLTGLLPIFGLLHVLIGGAANISSVDWMALAIALGLVRYP